MKDIKIGVLLRPITSDTNVAYMAMNQAIMNMILAYHAIPVGIAPPVTNWNDEKEMDCAESDKLYQMLDLCDGVILQGGGDFFEYDIKACTYLYEQNIPTLGICLGMQTMAVMKHGTCDKILQTHIDHLQKGIPYVHEVILKNDSRLHQILNADIVRVNSRHHDAVKTTELDIVGYSRDGIIEAVEDKDKTFFIGVQWHPENMIEYDTVMKCLISEFIRCSKNKEVYNDSKGILRNCERNSNQSSTDE